VAKAYPHPTINLSADDESGDLNGLLQNNDGFSV
jgi:hypothetical protein